MSIWFFKLMLELVSLVKKEHKPQDQLITLLVNLSFWSLSYSYMEENAIEEILSWSFILFTKISCISAANTYLDFTQVSVDKYSTSLSFTRCTIFALLQFLLCTMHSLTGNLKKKYSWRNSICTKLVLNTLASVCLSLLIGFFMASSNVSLFSSWDSTLS